MKSSQSLSEDQFRRLRLLLEEVRNSENTEVKLLTEYCLDILAILYEQNQELQELERELVFLLEEV